MVNVGVEVMSLITSHNIQRNLEIVNPFISENRTRLMSASASTQKPKDPKP
jgi:hypothetical protein